jgi:hypothetical protein
MTIKPEELNSLITAFDDSTYLCFTRGAFDSWRVTFLNSEGKQTYSPKDTAFFDYFLSLTEYGNTRREIFNIIKRMSKKISKGMEVDFDHLKKDIYKYAEELHIPEEEQLKFEKAMMSVLAAMLSEEQKAFTKLGKKLKLLGLHQVLIGKMEPKVAANWSRGKPWQEILKEYDQLNV